MIIDIIQIIGMSLNDKIMTLIGMITNKMTVMIQIERKIGRLIIIIMIVRIGIKIIHHLKILATDNNIEGVVTKKTTNLLIINHQICGSISQKGLSNFNMILREKALTPTKLDNHSMNMVNTMV